MRQGTAWSLKQKLIQVMPLREATKPKLDGRVKIRAYLGGVRSGKRGRGAAGTKVESDTLSCWTAVTEACCVHRSIKTGSGKKAASLAPSKGSTRRLANQDLACWHLTSFAWRFNRRYALDSMTERLAWAYIQAEPFPYRAIING